MYLQDDVVRTKHHLHNILAQKQKPESNNKETSTKQLECTLHNQCQQIQRMSEMLSQIKEERDKKKLVSDSRLNPKSKKKELP